MHAGTNSVREGASSVTADPETRANGAAIEVARLLEVEFWCLALCVCVSPPSHKRENYLQQYMQVIFKRTITNSYMQLIFRGTYKVLVAAI